MIQIEAQDLEVLRNQATVVERKRAELMMLEAYFQFTLETVRQKLGYEQPFTLDLQEGVLRPVEEPENGG